MAPGPNARHWSGRGWDRKCGGLAGAGLGRAARLRDHPAPAGTPFRRRSPFQQVFDGLSDELTLGPKLQFCHNDVEFYSCLQPASREAHERRPVWGGKAQGGCLKRYPVTYTVHIYMCVAQGIPWGILSECIALRSFLS